jgi:large subunit ribosomal protein L29
MESMKDLREQDEEQLNATLKEAYLNLFRLRVKAQTDRLDTPSELKRNRQMVARIKTIFSERRIAAAKEAKASAATAASTAAAS